MIEFKIGKDLIGHNHPTYFIADIAANHDGDLERAKKLITLAKENGANAVKFQHHNVKKYVSDYGFKSLGSKKSHQSKWNKSIFEIYKDAEVPRNWTDELIGHCNKIGITFFTTPYDLDTLQYIAPLVPAIKIGSGDINWHEMLIQASKYDIPILMATGASNMQEVDDAVRIVNKNTKRIILMQCNTNYTGSDENFKYVNLNVLKTYKTIYKDLILGLSDHTRGAITVLGSIALGAKVIEKHFTDDTKRDGPDHPFSMDPSAWKKMVDDARILESSLGGYIKKVEANEKETIILQRRSIRVTRSLEIGEKISNNVIEYQRPCPLDAININESNSIIGKEISKPIENGDYLRKEHIKW